MKTSTVLRKAAKLIGHGHWLRGAMSNGAGKMCALGAIEKASCRDNEAAYFAERYLTNLVGEFVCSWNDTKARDAQVVQRKLRRAAAIAEREGN